MVAKLVLPNGAEAILTPLGLTVGRESDNDIWLDDPTVSRRHARFEYVDGEPAVRDLGSSNGTFVNGAAVTALQALRHGDRITIGDASLVLEIEASQAAPAAAPPPVEASPPVAPPPVAPPAESPRASAAPAPPEVAAPVAKDPGVVAATDAPASPAEAPSAGPPEDAPPPPPAPVRRGASPAIDGVTRHEVVTLASGVAIAEMSPHGSLTIEAADTFRNLCASLVERGVVRFAFDLAALDYIDSSGLAAILQLMRDVRAQGGAVWFYNLTTEARTIFELTNLLKVLNIAPDRDTAVTRLQEA